MLFTLSAATAGLLAQVLPVFLLLFALEGDRLVPTPRMSFMARVHAWFIKVVMRLMVILNLAGITASLAIVQLPGPPSLPFAFHAIPYVAFLYSVFTLGFAVMTSPLFSHLDARKLPQQAEQSGAADELTYEDNRDEEHEDKGVEKMGQAWNPWGAVLVGGAVALGWAARSARKRA
jgi:hypothetical protein